MKKRFAQVLTFDVLSKVVLSLIAVALIRFMPTEQFAAFTLAVSAAGLAAQVIAAGANRLYIVGYERLGLAGRTEPLLALQLAVVALLAAAAWPLAGALQGAYPVAALLAGTIVASEFSKTYYQRELRFGRYAAIEVGRAAAQALAIGALIVVYGESLGAQAVLWAQAGALALAAAVALAPVLRWRGFADLHGARGLIAGIAAGPYGLLFAYFALIAVFSQLDVLMVKWLADDLVLASYGSALRYYGILSLALGAVHSVLLPAIQRAATRAELDRLYAEHFRLLLVFLPVVLLAAWGAQWLLPWVDRGRYPDAVPAFQVLAFSALISFAFSPHVNYLMKLERFGFLLRLVAVALAVDAVLMWLLVPRFGAPGAAAGTLIASACVTIPIFFESRRLRLQGS